MENLINYIHTNYGVYLEILGAAITLVSLIVKATPTQKDDAVLAKVIKVLSVLSLCNPDGSFIGKKTK